MAYTNKFEEQYFDPDEFTGLVDTSYAVKNDKLRHIEHMLIIRFAEEKISDEIISGKIKCPCHLGIGQEAIAVGIASYLRKTDKVFGAHRSHSHFLAMNQNVYSLFSEILGRIDGCSNGLGGSMHLIDQENGFYGSVPIVGATIPIATGAGLSIKIDKTDNLAVSYFGDGAVEEGVFHESLNLAKLNNLPILFVCENNLFASHMHILERQPNLSTMRFADAHLVPTLLVDGNDIASVHRAAKIATEHIRSGKGPFFLECVTYRWKGHVGPSDDNDVGLQRSELLKVWKKKDPVKRIVQSIIKDGEITEQEFQNLQLKVRNIINEAWLKAEASPFPTDKYLYSTLYSD